MFLITAPRRAHLAAWTKLQEAGCAGDGYPHSMALPLPPAYPNLCRSAAQAICQCCVSGCGRRWAGAVLFLLTVPCRPRLAAWSKLQESGCAGDGYPHTLNHKIFKTKNAQILTFDEYYFVLNILRLEYFSLEHFCLEHYLA